MLNECRSICFLLMVLCLFVGMFTGALLTAGEAHGADLGCRKDFWGTTRCSVDGSQEEVKIRDNIWGEKEILKGGKVVSRCKENIWGDLVCTSSK